MSNTLDALAGLTCFLAVAAVCTVIAWAASLARRVRAGVDRGLTEMADRARDGWDREIQAALGHEDPPSGCAPGKRNPR